MFWKASHQFLRIQANRFLMTTTENVSDVPEYANVKIGNNCFELSFESLVASMTHQYLSNSSNYHHNEDYDILFDVSKLLIIEYVLDQLKSKENIDILGNWFEDFVNFQQNKNKPLCKDVNITFNDGSIWQIKFLDLLAHKHSSEHSDDEDFIINYEDSFLVNNNEILEYLNKLSWSEVSELADEIQKPQPEPDYDSEYVSAKKEIVEWEKEVTLMDFFDINDIIECSRDEDDD